MQVVRITPPAQYLQPTPVPDMPLVTTGDLVPALHAVGGALAQCNGDKAAVRDYVERIAAPR